MDSDKDWYHGELTRVQAEKALRESQDSNCFLIRESRVRRSLTLSLIYHGEIYHTRIEYVPGQYRLQDEPPEKTFSELNDLVSHYRSQALHIDPKTTLGVACEKTEHATGKVKVEMGKYSFGVVTHTIEFFDIISNDDSTVELLITECKIYTPWHKSQCT